MKTKIIGNNSQQFTLQIEKTALTGYKKKKKRRGKIRNEDKTVKRV